MFNLKNVEKKNLENLWKLIENPEDIFLLSKLIALNIPYHLGFNPVYFCTECKNVHANETLRWRIISYSLILLRVLIYIFGTFNAVKFPLFHVTNLFRAFRWTVIYFTGIIQMQHILEPLSFKSTFRIISTVLTKQRDILPAFQVSVIVGFSLLIICITLLTCGIFLPIIGLIECKIHFLDDIFGICERGGALNTSSYRILLETFVHIVLTLEIATPTFICFLLVVEGIGFILAYFKESTIMDGNDANEMDYFLNVKWFTVYKMIQLGFQSHNYYFGTYIFPATFNFLITTSVITISVLIMYSKHLHILINIAAFFYLLCILFALVLELSLVPRFPSASYLAIQARAALLAKHRSLDKYHKRLIKSLKPVSLRIGPFCYADFSILPIAFEAIPTYTINLILAAK